MSVKLTEQERETLRAAFEAAEVKYSKPTMICRAVEKILTTRLAQACIEWSQRANEGLSVSVLAAKAAAWEEGFNAGSISAMQKLHTKPNFTPNPYRDQP
jgi:hypothetical protein